MTTHMTREQVQAFLGGMTIRQMVQMVEELEERWGVKAAVGGPTLVVDPTKVVEPPQETRYDVALTSVGGARVPVIRAIRELLGLSLRDARDLIATTPAILREQVELEEAERLRDELAAAGATVTIV